MSMHQGKSTRIRKATNEHAYDRAAEQIAE